MRSLARAASFATLLFIFPAGSGFAQQTPPVTLQTSHSQTNSDHGAAAHRIPLKGVAGFAEVSPTLYRGGQPTKQGLESLAKLGINIVVDARSPWRNHEGVEVQKLGMQYVSIPWRCPFPKDEVFAKFLKLIRNNPNKKIFVHCRLGDDRTGMMVAAYRMALQGWSAQDAMKEMSTSGFARWHHYICPGLASYEAQFPQRLKSSAAFADLR